jgi:type II secretory pathway component PulJ
MKRNHQKGFGIIEVLMLIAIVILIGTVVYLAIQVTQKKDTPVATTSSQSSSTGPKDTTVEALAHVKAFYKTYLDDKTGDFTTSEWVKQGYATQSAADQRDGGHALDLATCSQSPLTYDKYTFSTPSIDGDTGTMSLSGTYSGPPASTTRISLGLLKDGSVWKIDSFDCPSIGQ